MATFQFTLCLMLSLSLLCSGRKDVQVAFEENNYSFKVYIEGDLWFRSGVLGIRHEGTWWSSEHVNKYSLKAIEEKRVRGRDSIGKYDGVQ